LYNALELSPGWQLRKYRSFNVSYLIISLPTFAFDAIAKVV